MTKDDYEAWMTIVNGISTRVNLTETKICLTFCREKQSADCNEDNDEIVEKSLTNEEMRNALSILR